MKSLLQQVAVLLGVFLLVAVTAVPATAKAENYNWSTSFTVPAYTYQNQVGYQYQYQTQYLSYLLQLVKQLQAQLEALIDQKDGDTNDDDTDSDSEVEIKTLSATDIDGNEARLRGEIDFNDSDDAYVWFEWGEDEDDLDEETPHIFRDDNDDEEFTARITDLDEDEKYYFRAAGEDEDGEVDYGSVKSFRADENGNNDDDNDSDSDDETPEVETGDAEDISNDEAEIEGGADMNDFANGLVFFVYGEDEGQVEDIENDYDSYDDIDEDGDDLQKINVDSDLDGSSSYTVSLFGLDEETEYFYNFCVEYEDENDDQTLVCGNVESFETDN